MGPLQGETLWQVDLLGGRFDMLPERILVGLKAQAPSRLYQLGEKRVEMSRSVGGAPKDFIEVPGAAPMAIPYGSDLRATIEGLEALPETQETTAILNRFRTAEAATDGWVRLTNDVQGVHNEFLKSLASGRPYNGPVPDLTDKTAMAAMDNYQREAIYDLLKSDPTGDSVREYFVQFSRTFKRLTPSMTEFVRQQKSATTPNAPLLVGLAQAKGIISPGFQGSSQDRTGLVSADAFEPDVDLFLTVLNTLHEPGIDDPEQSVRDAQLVVAQRDFAKAQLKVAPIGTQLGDQESDEATDFNKALQEEIKGIRQLYVDAGYQIDGADGPITEQMIATYRLEKIAAYEKLRRAPENSGLSPGGDIQKMATAEATSRLFRSYPPVNIFGSTIFSRELRTLIDTTDWTEDTLEGHVYDYMIERGFTKDQIDSQSVRDRIRLSIVPNQHPGMATKFFVTVVPVEGEPFQVGEGGSGVIRREPSQEMREAYEELGVPLPVMPPDVLELDYKDSFEKYAREIGGQEGMLAFLSEAEFQRLEGADEYLALRAAMEGFWSAETGAEYLSMRALTGYRPTVPTDANAAERVALWFDRNIWKLTSPVNATLVQRGAEFLRGERPAEDLPPGFLRELKVAEAMRARLDVLMPYLNADSRPWRRSPTLREATDEAAITMMRQLRNRDRQVVVEDTQRDLDLAKIRAIERDLAEIKKSSDLEQALGIARDVVEVGAPAIPVVTEITEELLKKTGMGGLLGLEALGISRDQEETVRSMSKAREAQLRERLRVLKAELPPRQTRAEPMITMERVLDLMEGTAQPTDAIVGYEGTPGPTGQETKPVTERELYGRMMRRAQQLREERVRAEFRNSDLPSMLEAWLNGGLLPSEREELRRAAGQ